MPFFFFGRFYNLIGIEITWRFFSSSHENGEHDDAIDVLKRALIDGVILRHAIDVVVVLTKTMPHMMHVAPIPIQRKQPYT